MDHRLFLVKVHASVGCQHETAAMANLKPAHRRSDFLVALFHYWPARAQKSTSRVLSKGAKYKILVLHWRGRRQMMLETIHSLFEFLLKNSVHRMDDGDDD